jgi:hypothetical protein
MYRIEYTYILFLRNPNKYRTLKKKKKKLKKKKNERGSVDKISGEDSVGHAVTSSPLLVVIPPP